jgi:UDP-N-acetylglucosamine 1-carboxyvinyltransferase
MAAVLAKGTTRLDNAAMEPEITNLTEMLIGMGAKINGIGTTSLEIEGVDELRPTAVTTIPDRIEAGTMLIAGAMCGGKIRIEQVDPRHLVALTARLEDAGVTIKIGADAIDLTAPRTISAVDVTTAVYPGFPTDMQAQWIAMMTIAKGASSVKDTIYHDRFNHVPELIRLGADIEMRDNVALIRGVKKLTGAKVMSTDLRASAALILAALKAEGETEVLRMYHLDRGYESIEKKLVGLGASIRRVAGEEF